MTNRVLTQKRILFILVTVLLTAVIQDISYAQARGKIYWTESGKVRRANLNGSGVEDMIIKQVPWGDIELDLRKRKMYLVDRRSKIIYRANFNGTNIKRILEGRDQYDPHSIALDTNTNKIYWSNWSGPWGVARADNDGTDSEDIVIMKPPDNIFPLTVDAEYIRLDVRGGKIYFVDSFNDNIARTNLDGSKYESLGISIIDPYGLALDLNNRQMYWTHCIFNEIRRASLDGDNAETLLTELNYPTYIDLDMRSRKMYWVETDREAGKYRIRRANLNGSNVTDILTGLDFVYGIALDTNGFYDVSPDTNKLTTTWANMKAQ